MPKLFNNQLASCSLIDLDFLLLQTVQFDKSTIFPMFVFTTFRFLLSVFFLPFKQYVCFINRLKSSMNCLSIKFLVCFFISSYSFSTLFIKTNQSWLIFELIKVLSLDFANNTILSCFFFFFLIIDFHILIPGVIAETFSPIGELVISIGISSEEAKAKNEIHPVTVIHKKVFGII